jgi:integrase
MRSKSGSTGDAAADSRLSRHAANIGTNASFFIHCPVAFSLVANICAGCVTGMRLGELVALKWDCVDLHAKTLRVSETLQRRAGQIIVDQPKSHRSRRIIPLTVMAISALLAQQESQARTGIAPKWVFATRSGRAIEPRNVSRELCRVQKLAGLRFGFMIYAMLRRPLCLMPACR